MKAESKNPSEDLPNQEKNQYCLLMGNKDKRWMGSEGSDQENVGPLRKG